VIIYHKSLDIMGERMPTSVLLHTAGTCLGLAGTIAGVWWLNKNPLELSSNMIMSLTIVFILFLAVFVMIESISHTHLEKNYGFDPLRGLEWE
jgi:hypothetical protein